MRELFASDNFVLKDFLIANKSVPIDDLLIQLDKITKTVQNELFELINGDLAHFQDILKEACEVDIEAIRQFRNKIEEEKTIDEKNYLNFKKYCEEVDKRFQRLKYIQKKKEMVVKSRKAHQYIDYFKARQIKAENSLFELEIHVKNYNWLLKFTTEFSNELVESESDIHRELSQFNERLQEILEIHLKKLLPKESNDKNETKLLVKLCQELNKLNLFEASFKLTIIYPQLETYLQSSISHSKSLFNFKLFIEAVSNFVNSLKASWNEILKEFYAGDLYKFWVRTVLAPILTWTTERCSSVFSPISSDLNEFKNNFEIGLNFVSEIESNFFVYEEELIFFRSQSAWVNFMKKWALHQYYQARIKQFLAPIETSMSCGLELSTEPKVFEPTLVTINALRHLWTEEVIIKPLIPKFLKITLQTFRRFIDFCSEDVTIHRNPKVFLLSFLQKQYNLKEFVKLIEENLPMENILKGSLDGEEGLSAVILNKLKEEVEISLKKSETNLISDIERLYDQLLLEREEIQSLNLEAISILKNVYCVRNQGVQLDSNQLIQQILLKFNRVIFKLIDEKRLKRSQYPEIMKKMKEFEEECAELGYEEVMNEEFWLEIKAAIST